MPLAGLTLAAAAHAENQYTISLGGGVAPRYQGSSQYRGVVAPSFSATFDNGLFIGEDGIGYRMNLPHDVFVSAAVSYDSGRADENRFDLPGSDYLKGMGRIPGSVLVGVRAGVKLYGNAVLSVTLDTPVTHTTRGVSGQVDLAVPVFKAAKDEIVVTGSVHGGSGRYMQTFYGVTDAQAASSRFRPYSPGGGIDSVSMSAVWTHAVSQHWSILATAGVSRLVGRAGNSPIVQSRTNYHGMAGVSYRF
ncbi:structural protein MipA [Burkholderia ubonensis]|uniref:MipA/OmpV family protein n=1 Tax=Burkholderia ubonensis TaxID=101571 RepID=UPI0007591E36|nr:MipA/OmpV family protein [Burkholderia ubonensis]KVO46410.1 structural protein MipA [Burkholderia ubonensis]KVP30821.1 structural protein MipA [Burkholderia ubonensis]